MPGLVLAPANYVSVGFQGAVVLKPVGVSQDFGVGEMSLVSSGPTGDLLFGRDAAGGAGCDGQEFLVGRARPFVLGSAPAGDGLVRA